MDQFGKYLLLKRLAVGGMAEIFLAKQTGVAGFEKLVVVKRILPALVTEREFLGMFLDEARLAASLNHPNVVQIYDLGEVDGTYFIAMEFIAGHDLLSVIKRGKGLETPMPPELAARILIGACEGLHYAHTKKDLKGQPLNIVHRDVSPANLLISYEGGVKVADFGIAKAESQSSKTEAGKLKGKFSYMAPEAIKAEPIDARSDVFGLGIVLHEVLCGRRLFKRDTELAIMRDILDGEVKPPSAMRPDVPKALDFVCMKALSKDPRRRYQSAQEMQLDLEKFLSTRLVQPSSVHVAEHMMLLFEPDYRAYQALLRDLPNASPEELAQLFEEQSRIAKGISGNFSDPSISNPLAAEFEPQAVTQPAKRSGLFKLALGAMALVAVGGVALFASLRSTAPALPTSGFISLDTDPPGARVLLGGKDTGVVTPGVISRLPFAVQHTVRFELAGREPRETVLTLSPELPSKAISLALVEVQTPPGRVEITSDPPGAMVYVDGRAQKGLTPLVVEGLEANEEHVIRLAKEGFEDSESVVQVEPGALAKLSLPLKSETSRPPLEVRPARPGGKPSKDRESAQLSLKSDPPADVYFEGKSLGRTPLSAKLPIGRVSLAFVNKELDLSQTTALTVEKGKTETAVTFRKGKVAADVTPWADVYLGDRKLGTTPLAPRDLYEGTYTLRLVNSELGAIKTLKVVVHPGKITVVREALQ